MSGVGDFLGLGQSSGEKKLKKFKPANFTSGGLSGQYIPRLNKRGKPMKGQFDFVLSRSSGLDENLEGLRASLQERGLAFGGLRDRVAPGFGELTRTRVDAIRRAGERTVGNLRERFRQRRVLGSSFAEREIAGIESQFAAQEDQARAEAKIAELGLTAEFMSQEFDSFAQGFQSLINQYNLESSLAAGAAGQGTSALLAAMGAAADLGNARRDRNTNIIGTILGAALG